MFSYFTVIYGERISRERYVAIAIIPGYVAMAIMTLEQHNGPTLTDPSWSAVEAALRSVHPRDRSYFTLCADSSGYVQAAGARLRMICEWRRLAADGSFRHVVLGHPSSLDKLTSITTAAGVIQLRANEVMTLDEVLSVFKRFFERGEVPKDFALRDVTATFGGLAATQQTDQADRAAILVSRGMKVLQAARQLILIVMPKRTHRVATFDVLPGLPPYGDSPEAFTATGQGRHREGYVVRFHPDASAPWVGNFQPGLSSFDNVLPHPNGREFIVVAGGQGYVVDPNDRAKKEYFGAQIDIALQVPELNSVLFGNGLWFELLGPLGLQWRSRRISWDGMREVRREGLRLFGEAWSPLENCWLPFELNLCSGEFTGGSYNGPDAGA